jgi:hypothetical protein
MVLLGGMLLRNLLGLLQLNRHSTTQQMVQGAGQPASTAAVRPPTQAG